jgi:hypothetical protein
MLEDRAADLKASEDAGRGDSAGQSGYGRGLSAEMRQSMRTRTWQSVGVDCDLGVETSCCSAAGSANQGGCAKATITARYRARNRCIRLGRDGSASDRLKLERL